MRFFLPICCKGTEVRRKLENCSGVDSSIATSFTLAASEATAAYGLYHRFLRRAQEHVERGERKKKTKNLLYGRCDI